MLCEILVEEGKDPNNLKRLVRCAPEEATIVSGAGVCGCLAPLAEAVSEGTVVNWPAETLAFDRNQATLRYGQIAYVGSDTVARLVAAGC